MQLSAFNLLVIIALILAVVGLMRPAWQLAYVCIILIVAALLIGK